MSYSREFPIGFNATQNHVQNDLGDDFLQILQQKYAVLSETGDIDDFIKDDIDSIDIKTVFDKKTGSNEDENTVYKTLSVADEDAVVFGTKMGLNLKDIQQNLASLKDILSLITLFGDNYKNGNINEKPLPLLMTELEKAAQSDNPFLMQDVLINNNLDLPNGIDLQDLTDLTQAYQKQKSNSISTKLGKDTSMEKLLSLAFTEIFE
jgi:hypothetical protein